MYNDVYKDLYKDMYNDMLKYAHKHADKDVTGVYLSIQVSDNAIYAVVYVSPYCVQ